jgi:hypothetical protein
MQEQQVNIPSHPWDGKQGRFSSILILSLIVFLAFGAYDGATFFADFKKNCLQDANKPECKNLSQANFSTNGQARDITLDYGKGTYAIQVGAFVVEENARRISMELTNQGAPARVVRSVRSRSRVLFHVQVGRFPTQKKAEDAGKLLKTMGLLQEFVVTKYANNSG